MHPLAAPRALLTRRAVIWAADALADDDTTVNTLARLLDVDGHTLRDALRSHELEACRSRPEPRLLLPRPWTRLVETGTVPCARRGVR